MLSVTAEAQPLTTTKYQYYSINGASALEVYKSMLDNGPRVNGAKAYAATSAQTLPTGYAVDGQTCRAHNLKLKINFVIQLPQMTNENRLPPLIRSKWQQFSEFVKKHEETHRSIWMGCAREFEARAASLRSGDCESVDAEAAQLWNEIRMSCDRKHAAFDAAQQKVLVRHPFVKLVLGPSAPSKTIAAIDQRNTAALAHY